MTIESFVSKCNNIEDEGKFGKFILGHYKEITERYLNFEFKGKTEDSTRHMINYASFYLAEFTGRFGNIPAGSFHTFILKAFDNSMSDMFDDECYYLKSWSTQAIEEYTIYCYSND